MIAPAKQSHTLYQGATWDWLYRVVDDNGAVIPITGCTAKLSLRESVDDATALIEVTGSVVENDGTVMFTIPAATSVGMTWVQAVFDAELYWPGGKIDKLAIGKFKLIPGVTRA